MNNQLTFVALGGGNNIGASAYYINFDGHHILLDCGCGIANGLSYGPNLNTLLEVSGMDSLCELEAVFISHSHYDHMGYIPKLHCMAPCVPIYATYQTKALAYYQIWDKSNYNQLRDNERHRVRDEIMAQSALDSIVTVNYAQKVVLNGFNVTFYEAGHIPGAAMILLENENKKILYTGDFAKEETPLAQGYRLPDDLSVDTLIVCGLNARNPRNATFSKPENIVKRLIPCLSQGASVVLKVKQLTKGLELAKMLNQAMEHGLIKKRKIFIDDDIWKMAMRLEEMNVCALGQNCFRYPLNLYENGIYITSSMNGRGYFETVNVDFTLHATYDELKEIVKKTTPETTVVVHVGRQNDFVNSHVLEIDVCDEMERNIPFIYPDNNEIYSI